MRLNTAKCKVMHFVKTNPEAEYLINDLNSGQRVKLGISNCERDLGVFVSSDLRCDSHIAEIASKANRILGMLVKTFTCRDVELWKNLYISLVRPHLEFASTVWNPQTKGNIEALEKIQRRASKIPLKMKNLAYEDRLKVWGITTLEERRTRGDLIQMYKTVNELEVINWYSGPQFVLHRNTRATNKNDMCLRRENFSSRARNDFSHFVSVRHNFFLNRVSEHWNKLTNSQIHATNLNSFKARIDSLHETAATA